MAQLRRALAQLGLALLNATLLLALALALVVWQITARLDQMVSRTVTRLEDRLVLPDLGARLDRLETRLGTGAAAAEELRALRLEIAGLAGRIAPAEVTQALASALLDEAAARLGTR